MIQLCGEREWLCTYNFPLVTYRCWRMEPSRVPLLLLVSASLATPLLPACYHWTAGVALSPATRRHIVCPSQAFPTPLHLLGSYSSFTCQFTSSGKLLSKLTSPITWSQDPGYLSFVSAHYSSNFVFLCMILPKNCLLKYDICIWDRWYADV